MKNISQFVTVLFLQMGNDSLVGEVSVCYLCIDLSETLRRG